MIRKLKRDSLKIKKRLEGDLDRSDRDDADGHHKLIYEIKFPPTFNSIQKSSTELIYKMNSCWHDSILLGVEGILNEYRNLRSPNGKNDPEIRMQSSHCIRSDKK